MENIAIFYFVLEAKMGLFGNSFLRDLFFILFWMKSILTDVTPYIFSFEILFTFIKK